MDTSKPIKTINWSLFAALLVFLFILLLLSRCHPNVGVAVPPGASSTAPAALPQGGLGLWKTERTRGLRQYDVKRG